MKLDDLRDLDKDDVLSWLGLRRRSSVASALVGGLGLFAGGLALGAAAALLLAPKPGRALREDLKTRLRRATEDEEASRPVVTRDENNSGASRPY